MTGVDVAQAALDAARKAAETAGVAHKTSFERHDLAETFPTGSFDLVSAMFFQSPVEFERAGALRRAAAAVAPGGLLLIVTHGSRAPWSWADPETKFPTPDQGLRDLALDPARWQPVFVGISERDAKGPEGQEAKLVDNVIAMERL